MKENQPVKRRRALRLKTRAAVEESSSEESFKICDKRKEERTTDELRMPKKTLRPLKGHKKEREREAKASISRESTEEEVLEMEKKSENRKDKEMLTRLRKGGRELKIINVGSETERIGNLSEKSSETSKNTTESSKPSTSKTINVDEILNDEEIWMRMRNKIIDVVDRITKLNESNESSENSMNDIEKKTLTTRKKSNKISNSSNLMNLSISSSSLYLSDSPSLSTKSNEEETIEKRIATLGNKAYKVRKWKGYQTSALIVECDSKDFKDTCRKIQEVLGNFYRGRIEFRMTRKGAVLIRAKKHAHKKKILFGDLKENLKGIVDKEIKCIRPRWNIVISNIDPVVKGSEVVTTTAKKLEIKEALKIVGMKINGTGCQTIRLQTDSETIQGPNSGKITIGYTVANYIKWINIDRCYRCQQTNHNVANCSSRLIRCKRCSKEGHTIYFCPEKKSRCISCLQDGLSYRHLIGTFDCQEIYMRRIMKIKNKELTK